MRFRRALARVCGTSDSRYSTRTSLAPMLKFVQWSVLELLMPNGLREGLKLCQCCCWGTIEPLDVLRSAALCCAILPTSPTCLSRFLSSFVPTARGPKKLRRGLPCTPLERSGILWYAFLCLLVSYRTLAQFFYREHLPRQGVYASSRVLLNLEKIAIVSARSSAANFDPAGSPSSKAPAAQRCAATRA